jgi:hypothetical protein
MYTSLPNRTAHPVDLYRFCARAGGVTIIASWLVLLVQEALRPGFDSHVTSEYQQLAALAMVFGGYILGWWKEFAGGMLAIIGTITFFAVVIMTQQAPAPPAAVWFAAPGAFYLLASACTEKHSDAKSE